MFISLSLIISNGSSFCETDKDFQDTLKIVKEVKYAHAYSFKYSSRPGTPASLMENHIEEHVKTIDERNKEITEHKSTIASRDTEILGHKETIAAKDKKIGEQDETLNERNEVISGHVVTIASRDTEIEPSDIRRFLMTVIFFRLTF